LGGQDNGNEDRSGSLRGTVVNVMTREPIGRALVFSPDKRFATMTDDHGNFEFALPLPGSASLKADEFRTSSIETGTDPASLRPVLLKARKPGFLDEDEGGFQGVSVSPNQKEVVLPLIPEALIVGQVVMPEAEERIPVELYRREIQEGRAHWVSVRTTATKSNGEFRFAGLSAGKYKLLTQEVLDRDGLALDPEAQLYGYPPVYFPSAADLATAASIDLAVGGTFQATLTLVRQPYYKVAVPVASVPATEDMIQPFVPGFILEYNPQARKIEGFLPNGNYTIEASTFGSPLVAGTLSVAVKGAPLTTSPLILLPRTSIPVNVREEFSGKDHAGMSGSVPKRNGAGMKGPSSYLNITLWSADELGATEVVPMGPSFGTGDDSLTIPGVKPGAYWVQVDSSRGYPASITSGGTDLLHHPLVVASGSSSSPIEITMRDEWAHFIAKIEPVNEALSGASSNSRAGSGANTNPAWLCLVPLPDSPGKFQEISTSLNDVSGDNEVAPGEYQVLAFDHPHPELEYRNPEAMRAYEGEGKVVRLLAGQKQQVELSVISISDLR
jgi:hypothetical protein